MIVGATYLERGAPVTVLVQWSHRGPLPHLMPWMWAWGDRTEDGRLRTAGPRNVLIERADGTRVVRPFRGLRKPV